MGENEKHQNEKRLIYIKSQFFTKTVNILIDSGSELTLLNSKIVKDLKLDDLCFKIPKVTLVSANQRKIYEASTCIIAKVNTAYYIQFLLVDNMTYDAILGTDELYKHEVIFVIHIQIKDEIIKFDNYKQNLEITNIFRPNLEITNLFRPNLEINK